MHPVDRDVRLVAINRYRDIDRLRAVGAGLRLRVLDRPAAMDILLSRLRWLVRPVLGSRLALVDLGLLTVRIPLPRRRHQARIDDLAAPRQVACRRDGLVELAKQKSASTRDRISNPHGPGQIHRIHDTPKSPRTRLAPTLHEQRRTAHNTNGVEARSHLRASLRSATPSRRTARSSPRSAFGEPSACLVTDARSRPLPPPLPAPRQTAERILPLRHREPPWHSVDSAFLFRATRNRPNKKWHRRARGETRSSFPRPAVT